MVFFLMIRRPPRSTQSRSSAASDVYKRQSFEAAKYILERIKEEVPIFKKEYGEDGIFWHGGA